MARFNGDWDPKVVARAGAEHLDAAFPGWHQKVVLSRLDMRDGSVEFDSGGQARPCGCIGVQLDVLWTMSRRRERRFGYLRRRRDFDWVRGYRRYAMRRLDHGLTVPTGAREEAWGRLNAAWREEIRSRRARDQVGSRA